MRFLRAHFVNSELPVAADERCWADVAPRPNACDRYLELSVSAPEIWPDRPASVGGLLDQLRMPNEVVLPELRLNSMWNQDDSK